MTLSTHAQDFLSDSGLAPYYMVEAGLVDDASLWLVAATDRNMNPVTRLGVGMKDKNTGAVSYNGMSESDLYGLLVYLRYFLPEVYAQAHVANFESVLGLREVDPETHEITEVTNESTPASPPSLAPPPVGKPAPESRNPLTWTTGTTVRLLDNEEMGMAKVGALARLTAEPIDFGQNDVAVIVEWIDNRATAPNGKRQMDGRYHWNRFELADPLTEEDTIAIAQFLMQGALG